AAADALVALGRQFDFGLEDRPPRIRRRLELGGAVLAAGRRENRHRNCDIAWKGHDDTIARFDDNAAGQRGGLMLRERVDIATLEAFAGGLAAAAGFRTPASARAGALITFPPPRSQFALLGDHVLRVLPQPLTMTPLPANEPPAAVAFVPN